MVDRVFRQILDLEFLPNPEAQGLEAAAGGLKPLNLGRQRKKLSRTQVFWDLGSWLLVSLGIFARQALVLPDMTWSLTRLHAGSLIGSAAVALAVFRFFMRWLNRRRSQPGFEHIASSFGFGFFLDLSMVALLKIPTHLFHF
jgi:hypothetical protein